MKKNLLIAYRALLVVPLFAGGLLMGLSMLLAHGPARARRLLNELAEAIVRSE